MPVYVDNIKAKYSRMIMCHMIADSTNELLAMIDKIGVARRWIQKPGTPEEHFDICLTKRKEAIAAGAIEISGREMIEKIRIKREQL